MDKLGFFLTMEGIEGVGKSTALKFIENYLNEKQIKFISTREPGGTEIAEKIRQIVLTPNENEIMQKETELLLMFAGRAQHIAQVIYPALREKKWVVCDRYIDATYAYQGGGRGMRTDHIEMLDRWIVNHLMPKLTILLDTSPEIGLARAKHRGAHDRIEQETIDFFVRVRHEYLTRADNDPKRFRVIDASQPLPAVLEKIKEILDLYVKQYPQ